MAQSSQITDSQSFTLSTFWVNREERTIYFNKTDQQRGSTGATVTLLKRPVG